MSPETIWRSVRQTPHAVTSTSTSPSPPPPPPAASPPPRGGSRFGSESTIAFTSMPGGAGAREERPRVDDADRGPERVACVEAALAPRLDGDLAQLAGSGGRRPRMRGIDVGDAEVDVVGIGPEALGLVAFGGQLTACQHGAAAVEIVPVPPHAPAGDLKQL